MKKLLLAILLLPLLASAQFREKIDPEWGRTLNRGGYTVYFYIPGDTLAAAPNGSIARKDTTLYVKYSGSWYAVPGGGGGGSFYDSTLMASVKRLKDTAAAIRSSIPSSTGFILNQNASAQSGGFWVDGTGEALRFIGHNYLWMDKAGVPGIYMTNSLLSSGNAGWGWTIPGTGTGDDGHLELGTYTSGLTGITEIAAWHRGGTLVLGGISVNADEKLRVVGKSRFEGLAKYGANYGVDFDSRTLVDKGYVDSSRALDVKYTDDVNDLTAPVASFSMNSNKITNLADGVSGTDAVNLNQLNNVVAPSHYKQAVALATAAPLSANTYSNGTSGVGATLTKSSNGALTIDGQGPTLLDRVLIKDEATQSHNGIYVVTDAGSGGSPWILTRATDFDQSGDITIGDAVYVLTGGTANGNTSWIVNSASSPTMGTTAITFAQINNSVSIADNSITNSKLAQAGAHTFKGNNTGSTANIIDMTATQATAELDVFTSSLKGLVPASGGSARKVLHADGTWKDTTALAWGNIGGAIEDQTDLQAALAGFQAASSDLAAIAALTPSNDDIIQRKSGAWTNRTLAQYKTDLALNNVTNESKATMFTSPTFTGTVGLPSGTTLTTPVFTGLPTGSGVSASSTASTLAARDANGNLVTNNYLQGYTTTATAASTTTLTVSSTQLQYFTGTTTQTVALPAVSGLALGQSYIIVNNSTGTVTVQSSGGNTLQAMLGSTFMSVTCISLSGTGTASWSWSYMDAATLKGATLASGITASSLTTFGTNPVLETPRFNTGFTIGGVAASGKIPIGNGTNYVASTPTYPNSASTSGNVITSDGTNFTSATNNGGWTVLRVVTTDFTTTSTSLVDVTGLVSGTLATATLYEFEAKLYVNSTSTAGMAVGVQQSGTGSGQIGVFSGTATSGAATGMAIGSNALNTASAPCVLVNGDGSITITGHIKTGSTGSPTISLKVLKTTSGTAKVYIGSSFKFRVAQ